MALTPELKVVVPILLPKVQLDTQLSAYSEPMVKPLYEVDKALKNMNENKNLIKIFASKWQPHAKSGGSKGLITNLFNQTNYKKTRFHVFYAA